jgi:hypothetical protein
MDKQECSGFESQVIQRLDAILELLLLQILLNDGFEHKEDIENTLGYNLISDLPGNLRKQLNNAG